MNVQISKQNDENSSKVLKAMLIALLSLMFNPMTAFAQGADVQSSPTVNEHIVVSATPRSFQASLEMKQTTLSIISFMLEKCPNEKDHASVKVPAHVFAGVIQELQDRNAKFLPPGATVPAAARAVFQLKAEDTGLQQTVCLY